MILHHVAQRARAFVVTGATFDSERFRGGNLDMIDIVPVPKRREDRIRKAQHQNVLGCFFPEKMIDPIGLFFCERIADDAIEFARGRKIGSERFFDDNPRPAPFARFVQTCRLQVFQDRFELIRRGREIKKTIAACPPLLVDLVQTLRQTFVAGLVFKFALVIKNGLRESFPDFVAHRLPGEFSCRVLELASKFVIAFFATRKANDRDRGRQLAVGREIVESGDELAMSEVAGRAENHDAA